MGADDAAVKSVESALGKSATTTNILDNFKKELEDVFDEEELEDLTLDTAVTSKGGAEEVTQSGDFVDPSTGGAGGNVGDSDSDSDSDSDDECGGDGDGDGDDCISAVDSAALHSTSVALMCMFIVRMLLGNLHVA